MSTEEQVQKKAKISPKLKVYYFDIPGKGESIRLACAYGKLDWEDVRLSRDQFQQMKEEKKLAFGQLPALGINDETMLFQSAAIMRYVGKLAGLYPTNDDIKAAQIDAIVDQEADIFTPISVTRYRERFGFGFLTDEHIATVRKDLTEVVLPRHLSNLEAMLESSASGWLAGDETPSIADFILALRLEWLVKPGVNDGIATDLLDSYPKIKAMIAKFYSLPAVVEYYAQNKK